MTHYVTIENGKVIGIQNYEPEVPSSIKVVQISDEEHELILSSGKHEFDVETESVQPIPQKYLDIRGIRANNAIYRQQISSTDWMVLRHLREKALKLPTTLSNSDYIEFEENRQALADSIISIPEEYIFDSSNTESIIYT